MTDAFTLTVNGVTVDVEVEPDTPLLSVLRNELQLFGSRFGCGLGQCGACFVQVDGAVLPSCDTPIWSVERKTVITVEGLGGPNAPHPVQQALLEEQAAQCGFCISGIVVRAAALLEADPDPTPEAVAEALDRNLCRCGVQPRVIRAVLRAARATSTTA